ncbi:lipase YOR059C isoform X2 [Populus alba x Populus x berolinensis]|nr:lipase YOR059C isoform X2 [Populus alba x Populus x berolinensis]
MEAVMSGVVKNPLLLLLIILSLWSTVSLEVTQIGSLEQSSLLELYLIKVFVHCSEKNMFRLTLDGVDVMGERLAEEVLEVIQRKQNLRKISFVAHSVGGLVARYAIGRLYRPPKKENVADSTDDTNEDDIKATIGGLEPMNFITVATPHLGSRGNKQVPFLFGVTAFEKAARLLIHWIFKRTGRHLFLTDDDEGNAPLLKRMIEDYGDCFFHVCLLQNSRHCVYSNAGWRIQMWAMTVSFLSIQSSYIVGWRTSSIRRNYELPKWEDNMNKEYPHIVYEERCKARDAEQSELISTEDDGLDKLEVDVSFHASRQRFAAHSVIQVKDEMMHMEGADVIRHMIDHFLL